MEDSRDYFILLLKEKYEYELSRKKTLDDALGLPITLLSFIVAGLYLLVTDIPNLELTNLELVFKWSLFSIILFFSIITFIFLYKVYFGYRRFYSSFPNSDLVSSSYENLKFRHSNIMNDDTKEQFIISDLKEYCIIWYNDCNAANSDANDRRAMAFFRSRIFLGLSMIFGILLLIFICIVKTNHVK